jgi:hypothetical protein
MDVLNPERPLFSLSSGMEELDLVRECETSRYREDEGGYLGDADLTRVCEVM